MDGKQTVLSSEKKRNVNLGSLQEFLFLSSKKPDCCDKIVVPFCAVSGNKIDNESLTHLIPQKEGDPPREQWGRRPYFVYNVHGRKVVPLSMEGRLYLAYLHFSQKKYETYAEAVLLIKQIKPIDPAVPGFCKIPRPDCRLSPEGGSSGRENGPSLCCAGKDSK